MLYREAKNKKHQIEIVKQLTGYSDLQIEYILKKGGVLELKDDKKAAIMEQYNKGLSDSDIARATGIAQSQVSTFLRGEKLPANGKAWGGKKKETSVAPDVKKVVPEVVEKEPEVKAAEKIEKDEDKAVEETKEVNASELKQGLILPKPELFKEKNKAVQPEVIKQDLNKVSQEGKQAAEHVIKQRPKLSSYEANMTDEAYLKLAVLTLETCKSITEIMKGIWG